MINPLPAPKQAETAAVGISSATLALADVSPNEIIGNGLTTQPTATVTIFTAKQVRMMERGRPEAPPWTVAAIIDKGVSAAEAIADGEKIVSANGTGKVSFLPRQIKLFVEGTIISQLMQMKDPLPSRSTRGEADHAHGDDCGACSFNRLLTRSGVLNTMAHSHSKN